MATVGVIVFGWCTTYTGYKLDGSQFLSEFSVFIIIILIFLLLYPSHCRPPSRDGMSGTIKRCALCVEQQRQSNPNPGGVKMLISFHKRLKRMWGPSSFFTFSIKDLFP